MSRPRTDINSLLSRMNQPGEPSPEKTVTEAKPRKQHLRKSGKTEHQNTRTNTRTKARAETLVKTTFALAFPDLELLRNEQTRRREATGGRLRGQGIDLSALVREAIRKTYGR